MVVAAGAKGNVPPPWLNAILRFGHFSAVPATITGADLEREAPARAWRRAPGALPRSPAEYARAFYYDTLLFDRRACAI